MGGVGAKQGKYGGKTIRKRNTEVRKIKYLAAAFLQVSYGLGDLLFVLFLIKICAA